MARGGKREGAGRPKGSLDQNNKLLREMVLDALDQKGGAAYLAEQAEKNPSAFMSLLGRILPTQLTGDGGGPVEVSHDEWLNGLK